MTVHKKVCFVIRELAHGGIETVTLDLALELVKKNIDVTIVVLFGSENKYSIDGRIDLVLLKLDNSWCDLLTRGINKCVPLLGAYVFAVFYSRRLLSIIDGCDFDNIYLCGLGCYSLLFRCKIKNIVFNCHSMNSVLLKRRSPRLYKISLFILSKMLKNKKILCVSQGIAKDISTICSLPLSSIDVNYNILNYEEIKKKSAEKISTIKSDYILHVGRFTDEKNQIFLLEAYSRIKYKNRPKLIFLGDGILLNDCKSRAIKLGIEDDVIFIGFVSNPYPFIKNAKFLVLCSKYEGLPTVLLEAIYLHTYVISSNCRSGPNEIITDRRQGLLFELDEIADFTSLLVEALDKDIRADIHPGLSRKFDNNLSINYYLKCDD
ncbi:glycosyltransferase [Photobacterium phosphoreum]|uniref:glycosyltransferase n=1 Tax=Photobacterium phosphoreum TaxID=659 RepID=UPI001E54106B|nr:glycosyltransferase [Photobacterium phosphoreum]MCD9485056.1 glycosyltransferase [Photobacterium phosphoreum]